MITIGKNPLWEPFMKPAFLVRDLCKTPPFASRYCGTLGSNFNPQNTQCMDACPDFIGVVNPP